MLHVATLVFALTGVLCLASTRQALSGTFDEGNHLAAGLEWWQFGTYTLWTENPPLARMAVAALPYLHGMRLPPRGQWDPHTHEWDRSWQIGGDLLYGGEGFEQNMRRARLGTLPFFLLTLASVWALAGGRRRPGAGFIAVALTSTLPALIAHGALATTDVAFAGMFLLATLALWRWLQIPTFFRAATLGACVGLALLTKFSTLIFFPAAIFAAVAARTVTARDSRGVPSADGCASPWRLLAGQVAVATVVGLMVTWAGYRFSVGRMEDLAPSVKGWLEIVPPPAARGVLGRLLFHARIPMPELFHGLRFLAAHDAFGADAYLLGKVAEHGFAAFYPVALLVKTPLPLLLLAALALPLLAGRRWPSTRVAIPGVRKTARTYAGAAALTALALLLLSLRSHVNLGIRHVFVLLPLLAVAVGRIVDDRLIAWRGGRRRIGAAVLAVLLLWQGTTAVAAVSNELGYFNVLAGPDPAGVLLDSDLDWGQDLFYLRREVRARGVDVLKVALFGMSRLCRHELPLLQGLVPGRPTRGWIAISENYYRQRSSFMLLKDPCDPKSTYRDGEVPEAPFAWLKAYQPVAIAGGSIRLYHIP